MHEGLSPKTTRKLISYLLEHFSYVIAVEQYCRVLTPHRLMKTNVHIITNPVDKFKLPSFELGSDTRHYFSFVGSLRPDPSIQVEVIRIRAIVQAVA